MVTNQEIESWIEQIAPLVSNITGWDLKLGTLNCEVVPKNQGYEEILIGQLYQVGITNWEELMPDFFERLVEYLIEENILAAYLSSSGEILVIGENVVVSNLAGLHLILTHELVQRGQHIEHKNLIENVNELVKIGFTQLSSTIPDFREIKKILDQINMIMSLLENHAMYIQTIMQQMYIPDAKIESNFNIATMLFRLVGKGKVAQYSDRIHDIDVVAQIGEIDSLYANLKIR